MLKRGSKLGDFDPREFGEPGHAVSRVGDLVGARSSTQLGKADMPVATDAMILNLVRDDSLTRGLGDIEARMLVDWVVNWAELLSEAARSEADARKLVARLFTRGKAISRFVQLWFQPRGRGSAIQLAATERFDWPLPDAGELDRPCELMEHILNWESQHRGD